jgi:hypothetical protein
MARNLRLQGGDKKRLPSIFRRSLLEPHDVLARRERLC